MANLLRTQKQKSPMGKRQRPKNKPPSQMKRLLLLILLSLSGCASYSHVRDVTTFLPDGRKETIHETTRGDSALMKGDVNKLSSRTKDANGYSRDVNLGSLTGSGDTDMLRAVYEAGLAVGKKGAGVP